eukprot:5445347-Prymnesium_polylepis.1
MSHVERGRDARVKSVICARCGSVVVCLACAHCIFQTLARRVRAAASKNIFSTPYRAVRDGGHGKLSVLSITIMWVPDLGLALRVRPGMTQSF